MYNSWKKSRNYRRVIDENGNVIPVITVDGVDVEVTEEVYAFYVKTDCHEQYEEKRDFKKLVSLDEMLERHIPVESLYGYCSPGVEDDALDADEAKRTLERIASVWPNLNEKERGVIQALFLDGFSVREYAKQCGLHHSTMEERRDKAIDKLRRLCG